MHRMVVFNSKRARVLPVLSVPAPDHLFFRMWCCHVFCCKLCQINAIKERVKAVSALEREISKYAEEGKDEYKEVGGPLRSRPLRLFPSGCFRTLFTFWPLQQKESELQETNSQLHEAEKHKEKVSREMGTIRQDIDTQKVIVCVLCDIPPLLDPLLVIVEIASLCFVLVRSRSVGCRTT